MNKIAKLLIVFFCVACINEYKTDFRSSIIEAEKYISNYMDSAKVPGMQIAISHRGELIFSKGFGYANIEHQIPVNKQSKFRIASLSKPLTSALTAYLYQNKAIDIDSPVNEKLNVLQNINQDFTVRQLMSHAAGVRHYLPKDTNSMKFHSDIQDGLQIYADDSLLFQPGARFHYSSYGYNIIGAYLEKQTQITIEQLFVDSLFMPLQMNNSTIDHPYEIISERTAGYELDDNNQLINARFFDNRYKIPAGGLLSTAEDLVHFGNELLHGTYLNKESIELLFTPFIYKEEKDSDMGFSWIITEDSNGNKMYGHLGGNTGGCSAIMIYPELEIVAVWLGNRETDWSNVPINNVTDFFINCIK